MHLQRASIELFVFICQPNLAKLVLQQTLLRIFLRRSGGKDLMPTPPIISALRGIPRTSYVVYIATPSYVGNTGYS